MNADFQQIKDIFLAAVDKHPGAPRSAYLDEACGPDLELKRRRSIARNRGLALGLEQQHE